jgi:ligand-binding sensor domain-containing protein
LIIGSFGAGIFQEKKGAYTIVNPLSDPDGVNLNQQVVSDLRFDKDSILWIGTWNDGLLLYDFKFNEVKKALFKDGQSYRVFCINVLSDNSVWVGTNIGLLVYRDFNSTPEHFDKTRTPWLPDNDVLSIFEDEVGIVWIGTRGGGMVSLNRRINL